MTDQFLSFQLQNEQLQQQLEYTRLKPHRHGWWISKMQSDTLEERYAIKFCFKVGKKCHRNVWNASNCFWCILYESSISFWVALEIQGRQRSVRDDERFGRSKEVKHQNWLAKGLGLELLCWGFKGVKGEFPWEEASTLQIGSVAFPARTMHKSTDYLTKMGIKTLPQPPYSPTPCSLRLLVIP